MWIIGVAAECPGAGKDTLVNMLGEMHDSVHLKLAEPLYDIVACLAGEYAVDLSHRAKFQDREWKDTHEVGVTHLFTVDHYLVGLIEATIHILNGNPPETKTLPQWLIIDEVLVTVDLLKTLLRNGLTEVLTEPKYTIRKLMQLIGTEVIRKYVSPNIWVQLLSDKILLSPDKYRMYLVSDVRFPNEADFFTKHGKLVYITNAQAKANVDPSVLSHESESHTDYIQSLSPYLVENDGTLDDLQVKVRELYNNVVSELNS
jgi:hypothetical protein